MIVERIGFEAMIPEPLTKYFDPKVLMNMKSNWVLPILLIFWLMRKVINHVYIDDFVL